MRVLVTGQPRPVVLQGIALFELSKGLLAFAAAAGLISLRHTDLRAVVETYLLRHGFDTGQGYLRLFIDSVAQATHQEVSLVAMAVVGYGLLRLAEAYGLWRAKHWAEWFAVISAALFLPLEFYHFIRYASLLGAAVILFNLALVVYLANLLQKQRRQRLALTPPPAAIS